MEVSRAQLRLTSLAWAAGAGATALLLALVVGLLQGVPMALGQALSQPLEAALRSGGCGFFYGLLAFHLQRADPEDSHLQAGLVGAVCGLISLATPLQVTGSLRDAMMEALRGWLPLWLPLVGSALLLRVVSSRMRP